MPQREAEVLLEFAKTLWLTRTDITIDDIVILPTVVAAGALEYTKEKFVLLHPHERSGSMVVETN